jgi:hypothetical protein
VTKKQRQKAAKAAAAAVRAARDLMNHGGKHWIKGAEERLIDPNTHTPGDYGDAGFALAREGGELGYCSIGALKKVDSPGLARIALAEVIDPMGMKDARARAREDADSWCKNYGMKKSDIPAYIEGQLLDKTEDIIIGFNDASSTTWDDLRSKFTKAAARLADRARK